MDLHPLLSAVSPTPSHAFAALGAAGLGTVQMLRRKGDRAHRAFGWIFVALMAWTAASAAFISTIKLWGPFSPIHLLIPVVFASLWVGVRHARRGDVASHRRAMITLFVLALLITGGFTLYPGRIMHAVVFGS